MGRRAAYPGSFDPPTVAHLAIAEAALAQGGLERVVLVVSRAPLGKTAAQIPTLEDRVSVLRQVAASRPWLDVAITEARLIAEIAVGYDAIIMGADKWAQVVDPVWYPSPEARDVALAGLPPALVAPRPPFVPTGVQVLVLDAVHEQISSSAVRRGSLQWMLPEAAELDRRTGAWSQPERYTASTLGVLDPATPRAGPGPSSPSRRP